MKNIDVKWMRRVCYILDKMERTTNPYRKCSRCNKGVLIDRYFKFLNGRTFKVKIKGGIYYALFNRGKSSICFQEGSDHYSYGVRFRLGHSDHEFDIGFIDEKAQYQAFTLHWNDILDVEYEEITTEKYWEVVSLFIN